MAAVQIFNSLCPFHQRRCKCSARRISPYQKAAKPSYPLVSKSSRLSAQYGGILDSMGAGGLWHGVVPSRIGESIELDNAVCAVIQAVTQHDHVQQLGSVYYMYTLQFLQKACSTNEVSNITLMVAASCCLFESLVMPRGSMELTHHQGLSALFLSRTDRAWHGDEITRAIWYDSWPTVWYTSLVTGTASPFDCEPWISLQPTKHVSLNSNVARLRHLSQILLVKLPRLVALTRAARTELEDLQRGRAEYADAQIAIEFALQCFYELYPIRDEIVEAKLMKTTTTVETIDENLLQLTTESYKFQNYLDLEAALYYWQGRMAVLRIHSVLSDLSDQLQYSPAGDMEASEDETSIIFRNEYQETATAKKVANEKHAVLLHLLRTLDAYRYLGSGAWSAFFPAALHIYGAMQDDMDDDHGHLQRACTSLFQWYKVLLRMPSGYEEGAMKFQAELLIGGPLP